MAVRENEKSNRKSVSEKFQSYPRSGQKPNASAPEQAETRFLRKTYREISKISIYRCSGALRLDFGLRAGFRPSFLVPFEKIKTIIENLFPRSFKVSLKVFKNRVLAPQSKRGHDS